MESLLSEPSFGVMDHIGDAAWRDFQGLLKLVQYYNVTDVVVDRPSQFPEAPRNEMCDCLLSLKLGGIRVHELSAFCERVLGRLILDEHTAHEVAVGSHYHFDHRWQVVKRTVDFTVAIGLLILTLPLFVAIALAIRVTSGGPVFYRQERVGIGGKTLFIIKFRTMRVNAEQDGIARFASTNDDRVTRIGRFLRKTRIDELPQLLNVLVGDMSIVGPRPERPAFVKKFRETIPLYEIRHRVKPGVTGWAQVRDAYASSEEEARSKLSRDLYYIKNGSLWLDLRIMVRTAWVMLSCQGSR